jgi:uncharacterized phage protein (TIGR01671 family)
MREIQFRGKRVSNSEWIYGDLHHGILSKSVFVNGYEVDPGTVGQYTGLKDKNDVGIYEGDIVTWDDRSNGKYWRVAQVYYDKFGRLCYKFTHKTTTTDLIGSIWYQGQFAYAETTHIDLEIIGNIHENPELLGGSECEVFKGLNR